jgi:uncharacterized membrane protein
MHSYHLQELASRAVGLVSLTVSVICDFDNFIAILIVLFKVINWNTTFTLPNSNSKLELQH